MHEIKTVNVNGHTLAYREYGSGDKYLLSTQNFFFKVHTWPYWVSHHMTITASLYTCAATVNQSTSLIRL